MRPAAHKQPSYEESISHSGHRLTPQRREVYDILVANRDHPTATEVFMRVKNRMPSISLATVYNCLDTLVECGLARQVNMEREATRYCPNLEEHGHFMCNQCGRVLDVPFSSGKFVRNLPQGLTVTHSELTLHGLCAACSDNPKSKIQNRKSQ